jgi:hypothetical protein
MNEKGLISWRILTTHLFVSRVSPKISFHIPYLKLPFKNRNKFNKWTVSRSLLKVLLHYNTKVSKRKRVQKFQTLKNVASHLIIGTKVRKLQRFRKGVHATKFWQLQTNKIHNTRRVELEGTNKRSHVIRGWQLGFGCINILCTWNLIHLIDIWTINLLTLDVWPKVTWSHRIMVIAICTFSGEKKKKKVFLDLLDT